MDVSNLRYIIFLIDSKSKEHDGRIFCSFDDAKSYAFDAINQNYSDKAVIGMFHFNKDEKEMHVSMIETIGFKGDKKNFNQLELFKPLNIY